MEFPLWGSVIENQFCDLIFDLDLQQLIDSSTHIHGNTLNLLFTICEDTTEHTNVQSHPSLLLSDHFAITFTISTTPKPQRPAK